MESIPKPNDIEKYNLFGDALSKIVGHYFKEFEDYVQNLEEYYHKIIEIRVREASCRDYFICQVCKFATQSDNGPRCHCEVWIPVCYRCIRLSEEFEVSDPLTPPRETWRCKNCDHVGWMPRLRKEDMIVKPLPPSLPQ